MAPPLIFLILKLIMSLSTMIFETEYCEYRATFDESNEEKACYKTLIIYGRERRQSTYRNPIQIGIQSLFRSAHNPQATGDLHQA